MLSNQKHTTVNVSVIDEAFNMPQLQRTRRIWIYQPPGYHKSDKRYPVIYMHDGQNLFDEATAFDQEWGIDETLNSLLADCIVIGIDNSEHRMTEYNFSDNEAYGSGEGKRYMEFIVHTLKPFIDTHYKTKPGRENTHIAGSSMGGLISLYGALHFPHVFGGAGIFSPALWLVPGAVNALAKVAAQNVHYNQQLYFYGGAKEGCDMVMHIGNITHMLSQYPAYKVHVEIDPEGEHSEYHWRNKFPDFYKWLFAVPDTQNN